MATMVLTDASVTINAVDLSDHVKSVRLTYEAEMHDDTVMGTAGTRSKKPGLKNWSVEIEFLQDYASAKVDATLFPLVGASAFAIVIKPASGSVSTTNPSFTGNAVLASYQPLSGAVGELNKTTVPFQSAGALTRATS